MSTGPWLPPGWKHAARFELPTGHHLRPIRERDVDVDYPAVMGSRERLWSIFGAAWGWPPESMTFAQDRADLARHEREIIAHVSFNYAVFDTDEHALLGCVYIDPAEKVGADADVSWWVVDDHVDSPLDEALAVHVPLWIEACWPFARPRFIGRDVSWSDWIELPDVTNQERARPSSE